jgi:hypothetical protein
VLAEKAPSSKPPKIHEKSMSKQPYDCVVLIHACIKLNASHVYSRARVFIRKTLPSAVKERLTILNANSYNESEIAKRYWCPGLEDATCEETEPSIQNQRAP